MSGSPSPRTYGPAHYYFTLQMINTDWSQFVFTHLDASRARSHAVRLIFIFFRLISIDWHEVKCLKIQFLIPRILLFNSPNSVDLNTWTNEKVLWKTLSEFSIIQVIDFQSKWHRMDHPTEKTGTWHIKWQQFTKGYFGLKYNISVSKVYKSNFSWFRTSAKKISTNILWNPPIFQR